ncbi:class I SAM-dependent methyltransferase [Candidatus Pacearchaeota archaeon]|nr:MAG: class I SAM-dependent methyltransferase [Candidatus Pacearchaeota archaeon]
MLSKKQIKRKYNESAKLYDISEGILEIFVFRLRARLLKKSRGKVLDVACGTGRNFYYFPKQCKITATDFSEGMLSLAKKRALKLKRKIDFRIADTENLPFKDNTFDTVVNSLALCTYRNPVKALKEIARVCKPSGKILLFEHGASSNYLVKKIQQKLSKSWEQHSGCNLERNILALVKKSGLKILNFERKFFGVFCLVEAKPDN